MPKSEIAEARIDATYLPGGKVVLTSPDAPGVEFPVKEDDGTDRSGITYSIKQFRKVLEKRRLASYFNAITNNRKVKSP